MKGIPEEARGLQEEMRAHRRYLHANAELDMALPKTIAYVRRQLESMGYEPAELAGAGLVATAGGGRPGKVLLLRADMDALPGKEESGLEFACTNGAMHACGHDLHASMLLGAARLLKAHEGEIDGAVKLLFQPGEETLHGARAMIDSGVLESPKVDAAMMLHVFSGMPFPSGIFGIPEPGPVSAASDSFEIEIQGRGGHGAMPNVTVDPLNVLAHLHLSLQEINSREIQPTDSAVVTVGYMQGGSAPNVIPDRARLGGTVRTFSAENRDLIEKRIGEIARGVAGTFRAEAAVNYSRGCPAVVNDRDLCAELRRTLVDALGKEAIFPGLPGGGKMMASEDFAFYSERVPSVMAVLTAGNAKEGYAFSQHHPKVRFDEEVLWRGAAAYANFAIEWLAGKRP
jgi:hippurate hydrolase